MSISTVINSVMNGKLCVCVCVCVFPLQKEGRDHAHTQSVHTVGGEADDAHQHCLYHHLQHSVWGRWWLAFHIIITMKMNTKWCSSVCFELKLLLWHLIVNPLSVQILTEQVCTQVVHKPHPEPDSTVKIQNPSKYKNTVACTCMSLCVLCSANNAVLF